MKNRVKAALVIILGVGILLYLYSNKDNLDNYQRLNCYLLSITFLAILWYSLETHFLRETAIEQKELQIQPLVIIEFVKESESIDNAVPYLKNIGNGIAMNINIKQIERQKNSTVVDFSVNKVNVLRVNESMSLVRAYSMEETPTGGSISAANIASKYAEDNYGFIITYENIQRVRYKTKLLTGKDGIQVIYWGR